MRWVVDRLWASAWQFSGSARRCKLTRLFCTTHGRKTQQSLQFAVVAVDIVKEVGRPAFGGQGGTIEDHYADGLCELNAEWRAGVHGRGDFGIVPVSDGIAQHVARERYRIIYADAAV